MRIFLLLFSAFILNVTLVHGSQNITGGMHWQEGILNNTVEFSGQVAVPEVIWIWHPKSISIDYKELKGDYNHSKRGYWLYEEGREKNHIVLRGRTSQLVKKPKPGLQPIIKFIGDNKYKVPIVGKLKNGQVRYGEMTFEISNIVVYQDNNMRLGWIAQTEVTREEEDTVSDLLSQIPGYAYNNILDSSRVAESNMFNYNGGDLVSSPINLAGGWLTTIKNIKIYIPDTNDQLEKWSGILSPVVYYF